MNIRLIAMTWLECISLVWSAKTHLGGKFIAAYEDRWYARVAETAAQRVLRRRYWGTDKEIG